MDINSIMKSLEDKVINNEPISAGYWVESALRINTLLSDKDNELACYEAEMVNAEANMIEEGQMASKAKVLKTKVIDYKAYLLLKGELKRINEYILLAKRRASINEF